MTAIQAEKILAKPLKFGDRLQIAAYERMETQAEAERTANHLDELTDGQLPALDASFFEGLFSLDLPDGLRLSDRLAA